MLNFCTEDYIEHLESAHPDNAAAQSEASALRKELRRTERELRKRYCWVVERKRDRMGQGLYNMLGWGVLNPPYLKGDDAQEALFEEVDDLAGVRRAYEAEPDYLVVPLAVDDGYLQDWWQIPELPESILRCAPRRARYAEYPTCFAPPGAAREKWQSAKLLFEKAGLMLPDARLVVINDWY